MLIGQMQSGFHRLAFTPFFFAEESIDRDRCVRSSNPFGNSRTIIGVVQVTSTASVRGGKFTSLLYFNLRLCKEECKRFTGVYDTAYMR